MSENEDQQVKYIAEVISNSLECESHKNRVRFSAAKRRGLMACIKYEMPCRLSDLELASKSGLSIFNVRKFLTFFRKNGIIKSRLLDGSEHSNGKKTREIVYVPKEERGKATEEKPVEPPGPRITKGMRTRNKLLDFIRASVPCRLSDQDLAMYLGLKTRSVQKVLKDLKDYGIIRSEVSTYTVYGNVRSHRKIWLQEETCSIKKQNLPESRCTEEESDSSPSFRTPSRPVATL